MHEWILWLLVAGSAIHVMEEHALGWQGWATNSIGKKLGIELSWSDFYVTNFALIIIGISTAIVGWQLAVFALAFAALNIINALFFHVVPSIREKRLNPGCITAVLLYLPLGFLCYWAAHEDKVLDLGVILLSIAIGALLMASALIGPILRKHIGYSDVKQ